MDIELVIKIPEKTINEIKDNAMFAGSISSDIRWDVTGAIVNGTPLPKGHGRLIDVSNLLTVTDYDGENEKIYFLYDEIDNTPTIIESDKEEK